MGNRNKLCDSILDLIGQTPMVRINNLASEDDAEIYLKLETYNPGGSVKDRAAYGIIRQAEKDGLLKPGGTIIELTSGNTGIGLASIGGFLVIKASSLSVKNTIKRGLIFCVRSVLKSSPLVQMKILMR